MKRVFFDESGNTGQNLIDEADPIFVLASCSFQVDEEEEVLSHFQQFKGPELKFSRLRKTAAGQKAVLGFLASDQVHSNTAAAYIVHKPFMVVAKYCDLVLEPSLRQAGIDFYKNGLNIATANLLTTSMPVFLNPRTWTNFLSLFVRLVRRKSPGMFSEWRRSAELIYAYLEHSEPESASFIGPVLLFKDPSALLEGLGDHELDPLIPAYFFSVDHWGKMLGEFYEVIADESKVLAKTRDLLLALSNPELKSVDVGYDRRKTSFPLKASDIVAVDSTAYPQVQLADVLSGALATAAKVRAKGALVSGTFVHDILELCFSKKLVIGGLWPSHEVDPEELETNNNSGSTEVDAITYIVNILRDHSSTKNKSE